jgi:hypothetical protein
MKGVRGENVVTRRKRRKRRRTYGIGPSYWSDIFEVYVFQDESSSFSALYISFLRHVED